MEGVAEGERSGITDVSNWTSTVQQPQKITCLHETLDLKSVPQRLGFRAHNTQSLIFNHYSHCGGGKIICHNHFTCGLQEKRRKEGRG